MGGNETPLLMLSPGLCAVLTNGKTHTHIETYSLFIFTLELSD